MCIMWEMPLQAMPRFRASIIHLRCWDSLSTIQSLGHDVDQSRSWNGLFPKHSTVIHKVWIKHLTYHSCIKPYTQTLWLALLNARVIELPILCSNRGSSVTIEADFILTKETTEWVQGNFWAENKELWCCNYSDGLFWDDTHHLNHLIHF